MKVYTEFYDLPEMARLPVNEARALWNKFLASVRWFRFFRRMMIMPIALAYLPLFGWLFPGDFLLPALAAFFVAMETVLFLDGPIEVFLFRKRLNRISQTKPIQESL